nr:hypothetical protein [Saprospiraceae bacterium]
MNTDKNPLDELFQREAAGFDVPLSEDEKKQVWGFISSRRKRRFIGFWLSMGFFLLLLVGAGIYHWQDSATSTVVKEVYARLLDKNTSVGQQEVAESTVYSGTDENYSIKSDNPSHSFLLPGEFYVLSPDILNAVWSRHATFGFESDPSEIVYGRGDSGEFTENHQVTEKISNPIQNTREKSHTKKSATASSGTVGEVKSFLEIASGDGEIALANNQISPLSLLFQLSSLPLIQFQLEEEGIDLYSPPLTAPAYSSESATTTSRRLFLDLYSRISFNQIKITASEPQFENYKEVWEETILPYFAIAAGFRAGIKVSPNWSFSTGLEYSRITEKYDRRTTALTYKMQFNDKAYYYEGENGDPVWVGDSIYTPILTESGLVAPNTHEFISIPLQVTYTLPFDQWNLGVSLGTSIHLWQSHSGLIPRVEGGFRSIEKEDYRKQIFSDLRLAVSLGYTLNADWELYLQTGGHFGLGNAFDDHFPLEKKMRGIHLTTGLRRNF